MTQYAHIPGASVLDDLVDSAPLVPALAPAAVPPPRQKTPLSKRKMRYTTAMLRACTEKDLAEVFAAMVQDAKGEVKIVCDDEGKPHNVGPEPGRVTASRKLLLEYLLGKPQAMQTGDKTTQNLTAVFFGANAPRVV